MQVKIDVTKYAQHHAHNDFELDQVFGIAGPFADRSEISRFGYVKANHWTEFLKRTPFRKKTVYNNESYIYDEQVLKLDGYYIEGYWQSEKYLRISGKNNGYLSFSGISGRKGYMGGADSEFLRGQRPYPPGRLSAVFLSSEYMHPGVLQKGHGLFS